MYYKYYAVIKLAALTTCVVIFLAACSAFIVRQIIQCEQTSTFKCVGGYVHYTYFDGTNKYTELVVLGGKPRNCNQSY